VHRLYFAFSNVSGEKEGELMHKIFHMPLTVAAVAWYIACAGNVHAVMNGPCSGCHTMHNSQDNQPMRYDSGAEPLAQLLRGDCYGCHAQGLGNALYSIGVDVIPQVLHTDASKGDGWLESDLAGGNFAYISGLKAGIGVADSRGHNIAGLTGATGDATLFAPPGGIVQFGHNDGFNVNTNNLSCAGTNGCHGNRYYVAPYEGITGAHHNNANGAVTQADGDMEPGHGYRFLLGVNGYEDPDWQYTRSSADHNEYFGLDTPIKLDCSVNGCHLSGGIRPPSGTMAEYCGTCHGNFHTLETTSSNGIGPDVTSPFIRHPSDLSIDNSTDFATYSVYRTDTPVARRVVAAPSSTVAGTDAVFCLSCHVAHASPYPDMLKWDYSTMDVGNAGGAAGSGCFACHSSKE
jgi:hypothetical protein